MTWIDTFRSQYKPLLDRGASGAKRGLIEGLYQRGEGFDIMFRYLLSREQPRYEIVETGTLRNPGQWKDGQSAKLFTEFVTCYGGRARSVDIDPDACDTARQCLDRDRCEVHCADSVTWLSQQTDLDRVDLYYLDSWDVKWDNDHDSAQHHLREFHAIAPRFRPGVMVAIDDNSRLLDSNRRTGKGRLIVEYLDSRGITPVYDRHQIIYIFPGPLCL